MQSRIATTLVDALHQDPERARRKPVAGLTPDEWRALVTLARAQGVDAMLGARLGSRGLDAAPPEIRATLLAAYRAGVLVSLRRHAHLGRILTALRGLSIPVIVLKGAYLATVVYPDAALRRMSDVDLLVRVADLDGAAQALRGLGYRPATPWGDTAAYVSAPNRKHLPAFLKPHTEDIELHWRLWTPGDPLDTDALWTRAVPARLAGVDTQALCPEDLLIHVCVHASYGHLFSMGLRAACDIAETIRRFGHGLAWDAVEERARRIGRQRGIFLSLRLASDLVGAAVPGHVLQRLRPADFDEALVGAACALALEDQPRHLLMSSALVEVCNGLTWRAKLTEALRRVFLAPSALALRYGLPADSMRAVLYYPVRVRDLLWRYGRVTLRVLRGDDSLAPMAAHVARVKAWLPGSDGPALGT